jgi:transposase
VQIQFEQLLNLPDIQILNVEITEHEIKCDIESTRGYSICHRCGQKATKFFEHGETLTLQHLPICEKDVYLYLKTKRFRCLDCDGRPTTTERCEWYDADAKCTRAFADFLLRALVNSTISDVSIKYRVAYDRVRGVLNRYVRGEVAWNQFKHLRQIGLDEISLLKGHRDFVAIVSTRDDRGKPVVLAVLKDRKKETITDFLKTIPEELRATIKEVCTDLYEGFINAAAEILPQAKVVGDRFHVAKLYRAALDALRKKEMKGLKRILDKQEYAGLKGALWALRKKPEDMEPEEHDVLELLFKYSYELRRAYALREKLTQIFDTKQSPEAARGAIQGWIAEVKRSGLDCFDKFIATLKEHMEIVTNYFTHRSNSGWVEGLNNKIKVLKRRCYGITNPISLFRRIWLDLRGYEAFAH